MILRDQPQGTRNVTEVLPNKIDRQLGRIRYKYSSLRPYQLIINQNGLADTTDKLLLHWNEIIRFSWSTEKKNTTWEDKRTRLKEKTSSDQFIKQVQDGKREDEKAFWIGKYPQGAAETRRAELPATESRKTQTEKDATRRARAKENKTGIIKWHIWTCKINMYINK